VNELAIAIIGFPNCDSSIPFARHKLRAPAILLPKVDAPLRNPLAIASSPQTQLEDGRIKSDDVVQVMSAQGFERTGNDSCWISLRIQSLRDFIIGFVILIVFFLPGYIVR